MMEDTKRKAFLNRISRSLGREEIPTKVAPLSLTDGPQVSMYQDLTHDEVVTMFKAECDKVGTKYIETIPSEVGKTLLAEIQARGGGKVIYPKAPEITNYGLAEVFSSNADSSLEFVQWDTAQGREANINNTQDAAIGVTFPIIGIAETATILQPSNSGSGRSIGLLPITHIAVLKKSTIVPRMTQSMAILKEMFHQNPEEFPSNLVHISGPSNTSDIELVRVVGVHGPINVTFILVED